MEAVCEAPRADLSAIPVDPMDHQGLVNWVADKFAGRGLDFEDLAAEAQVALVNACRYFDPGRGIVFSTYATTCIIKQLTKATGKQSEWRGSHAPLTALEVAREPDEGRSARKVVAMLDSLPETWATVLRLRYGFDREPLTVREVATVIGRSHQRVFQLEQQAIKRLRAMAGAA